MRRRGLHGAVGLSSPDGPPAVWLRKGLECGLLIPVLRSAFTASLWVGVGGGRREGVRCVGEWVSVVGKCVRAYGCAYCRPARSARPARRLRHSRGDLAVRRI